MSMLYIGVTYFRVVTAIYVRHQLHLWECVCDKKIRFDPFCNP